MTGSSGIDEDAFAQDGGWQGGDGAGLLLKGRLPPDGYIKSAAEGAEDAVGEFGFAVLAVCIIRNNQKQVEIAVQAGISTGLGAEQPNGFGLVGFGEAGYGIAEGGGSSGFTRGKDVTDLRKTLISFVALWLRVRICFHSAGIVYGRLRRAVPTMGRWQAGRLPYMKCSASLRICGRRFAGSFFGHAVVEGVFEADEFAEEGIEAAVGVWGLFTEKVVELDFGVGAVWGGSEKAGAFEARAGDLDEAAFDAEPAGLGVAEALPHEVGAGEFIEEVRGGHGFGGVDARNRVRDFSKTSGWMEG